MGLRFRSEFDTITQDSYKLEIHDSNTVTYGPDLIVNPKFDGIDTPTDPVASYSIGDQVGGGYVFNVNSTTGEVYVISNSNVNLAEWGCSGTIISGASNNLFGAGKSNTEAIASQCSQSPIAAKTSLNVTLGGYEDWFLPSLLEWDAINANKATLLASSGFTQFSQLNYWSSSQAPTAGTQAATHAYAKNLNVGTTILAAKTSSYNIRPIRSFIPFGPFKAYGSPNIRSVQKVDQRNWVKQFKNIRISGANADEGFKYELAAGSNKKYELEFSSYDDPADIFISGSNQGNIGGWNNKNGETRIQFTSTSSQTITIKFRHNNNSAGTTFYKNIRLREVLIDVVEFDLRGSDGFKLSYSGSDSTYDLIKPSTLNFTVNVDNSQLEQLAKDIASSAPERFLIKIYRADIPSNVFYQTPISDITAMYELYWFGYINKRVMSIKDMPYPFDLNVAAVDGILDLKGKDYKDSSNVGFTGKKGVKDILCQIVDKIDVQSILNPTYDEALMTRINWFEEGMSTSDDPSKKTFLHVDPFTTATDDGLINYSSYYDVLESVCRLFQARFLLSDGVFTFIQFENQTKDTTTPFIYTKSGSSNGEFDNSQLDLPINNIYGETTTNSVKLNSSQTRSGFFSRTKSFGNKITNVQIPFSSSVNAGNILPSNLVFPLYDNIGASNYGAGWLNVGPDCFGSWEANDNISFEFTIKFNVTAYKRYGVTPNTPDQSNDFNGKVYIPFYLLAKSDSGDRYWKPSSDLSPTNTFVADGDWVSASSILDNAAIVKTKNLFISNNSTAGTASDTVEVTFSTSAANVHDFDSLHLYVNGHDQWKFGGGGGENAWWGVQQSGQPNIGRLEDISDWQGYRAVLSLENISLTVFQNGSQYIDYITQSNVGALINANQNNPELLVIKDIIWGDGPDTLPLKAIWTGPVASVTSQTENWTIDGVGTQYKIHELISDQILSSNYLSAEVLQAQLIMPLHKTDSPTLYWRISPYLGFNRKFIDSNNVLIEEDYCFSSMSFSANKGEWAFKGKKIGLPTPTVNSDTVYLGTGVVSQVAQISTAGDISQNTNNELTMLDESVNSSSGALTSLTVTTLPLDVPAGTVIQMQSSGATGVWEQVVLSANAVSGATTIAINSWTPSYSFLTGTPLIITTGAIFSATSQAAGSDTEVQYNDSGELAGSSSLTFEDSTGTLTATAFSGDLTGDVTGDLTGNVTATSVLADGVTATTQAAADNTTKVATTAFVQANTGKGAGSAYNIQYVDINGDLAGGTQVNYLPNSGNPYFSITSELRVGDAQGNTIKFINLPTTTQTNVIGIDSSGQLYKQAAGTGGGGTPAGNNLTIQYNDNGSFGGDNNFKIDPTNNILFANGKIDSDGKLQVGDFPTATTTYGALGNHSFAQGSNTIASGHYAVALNNTTTASALDSVAMGEHSIASGRQSLAGGWTCTASGPASFAFGALTTASGERAICFGANSFASGKDAVVMGFDHSGIGDRTLTIGYQNVNRASNGFVMGQDNVLKNMYANSSTGAGTGSFVGGYNNIVEVNDSIVFGSDCDAGVTSAGGNNSKNQFLFGLGLGVPKNIQGDAAGQSQTVVGKYNSDQNQLHSLFVVGNGDNATTRSNAFLVDEMGRVGIGYDSPTYTLDVIGGARKSIGGSTWATTSDERVKKNIRPYEKGLSEIIQIETKVFNYNGKGDTIDDSIDNVGVIAQEISKVFPNTVEAYNSKLDKNDDEETEILSFNPNELTYALINSVKELNAEVQALRKELNELKNK